MASSRKGAKKQRRTGSEPPAVAGGLSALHEKRWAVMTFGGVLGMDLIYDDARRIATRATKEGPGATVVTNAAAARFIDLCRHGVGV